MERKRERERTATTNHFLLNSLAEYDSLVAYGACSCDPSCHQPCCASVSMPYTFPQGVLYISRFFIVQTSSRNREKYLLEMKIYLQLQIKQQRIKLVSYFSCKTNGRVDISNIIQRNIIFVKRKYPKKRSSISLNERSRLSSDEINVFLTRTCVVAQVEVIIIVMTISSSGARHQRIGSTIKKKKGRKKKKLCTMMMVWFEVTSETTLSLSFLGL